MLHTALIGVYEKCSPLHDGHVNGRHWLIFGDVCMWCTLADGVCYSAAAPAVVPVAAEIGLSGKKIALRGGGGVTRKPIFPTPPPPSFAAVTGGGGGSGRGRWTYRAGGGGGVNPTSMAQNDTHVALIILTTQMWGGGGGIIGGKNFFGPNFVFLCLWRQHPFLNKTKGPTRNPISPTPPPPSPSAGVHVIPPPSPRRAIFRLPCPEGGACTPPLVGITCPEAGAIPACKFPSTALCSLCASTSDALLRDRY